MNDIDQTNATRDSIDDYPEPVGPTRRSVLRTVGAAGAAAVASPVGTGLAGASAPPENDGGAVKPILAGSVATAEMKDAYNHHADRLPGWLADLVGDERVAIEVSKEADQVPAIEDQVIRRIVAETNLTLDEATAAVNALTAATDSAEPRIYREGR